MIQEVPYTQYAEEVVHQLPKGAFLTTKKGEEINTMAIGWGTLGVIWNRPIFTVAVRYSRHTYDLLKGATEFTVSIPLEGNPHIKKALGFSGTHSGREVNKFEECQITAVPGQKVEVPIIGECELHYECKIVYRQAMEPALVEEAINQRFYQGNNDYHVIYYGEIVACYLKK
ncbi:MAG: flavin reductase family protein [Epulopiscium sp.]|nr:flavin reductase family protein [Candidatus Epulonipiscium sp.]